MHVAFRKSCMQIRFFFMVVQNVKDLSGGVLPSRHSENIVYYYIIKKFKVPTLIRDICDVNCVI